MSNVCSEGLDPYEILVQKTLDKHIPLKVDWEITYRCNLRCAHCYQQGMPKSLDKELTTKEIFLVMDQLADMGCLFITFTGGEIFLRSDIFELMQYARDKGFAIRLFSNGTLIDNEQIVERIYQMHPLAVELSLYGIDPQVHQSITGVSGSQQATLNAFKLLKDRGIKVIIKCTVMKSNVDEFDALSGFAKEQKNSFNYTLTVIPQISGKNDVAKLRLDQQQLRDFYHTRPELAKEITSGGVASYDKLCSAGLNSLYISPYGEVFPCVALRVDCGNIRQQTVKECWNAQFFKKLRGLKYQDLPQCRVCEYAGFCDRCAGMALQENNDLRGVSPNDCALAQVRHWVVKNR